MPVRRSSLWWFGWPVRAAGQQRVWGDAPTSLIADGPADAIVPRLTRLLQHLRQVEPSAGWEQFLQGDALRGDRMVLAGQSQGGGMAAFLAQTLPVAGVLMFSGGWDHGPGGDVAAWYRRASVTPLARWHAVHHAAEPQALRLTQIDEVLGVPQIQRHALSEPVVNNAHTEGISNPIYRPLWRDLLARMRP